MTKDIQEILKNSKDPKKLVWAAQELASSPQKADHEMLLNFINSEEFLHRLDSEKDYAGPSVNLRVNRILQL